MCFFCLHVLRRRRPDPGCKVYFIPAHQTNRARAAGRQNDEGERLGADAFTRCERLHEGRHLLPGQRRAMFDWADAAARRKGRVQIALPCGGISELAGTQTLGAGMVQDGFDALAHPLGGFGDAWPDGIQHRQDVRVVDGGDRLVADNGEGMPFKGADPLVGVLLAF